MSNSYAFLDYLDSIKRKTGKTEEEISEHVGRHKNYIAQLKSRLNNGGCIPQKFIDLVHLHFDNELEDGSVINRNRLLEVELGELNEKFIRLQAKVNVMIPTQEHILSLLLKTEVPLISAQLQQAMNIEADRLFDELRNKS